MTDISGRLATNYMEEVHRNPKDTVEVNMCRAVEALRVDYVIIPKGGLMASNSIDEAIIKVSQMLDKIHGEFVFAENGRANSDDNLRVTKAHIETLLKAALVAKQLEG